MTYRALILSFLLLLAFAGASAAQDPVAEMTRNLQAEGFAIIAVERTLLGRVMIRAENAEVTREIVIDPATGEILRDYSEEKGGSGALEPPGGKGRRLAASLVGAPPRGS